MGVILTDASPIAAIYTAQITDPLRWDQGFVDAVIYGLAQRICFELTGKEERVRALAQMAQGALLTAGAEMANEGPSVHRLYLPETLRARGFGDKMN